MVLQIQRPEILRLVEELSRRTGMNAEAVVESALQEQFDRLEEQGAEAERRAQIYALVAELQAAFRDHPEAAVDPDELLYGEDGLPR